MTDKPYLTKHDSEWSGLSQGEKIEHGQRRAAAERAAAQARGRDDHLTNPPAAEEPEQAQAEEPDAAGAAMGEPEPMPETASAMARRRRLLGDLAPEAQAMFSDEDLARIDAEEEERAQKERKKQYLADIRATAQMHARIGAGLLSASVLRDDELQKYMNQEIEFVIDLPLGSMPAGKEGIRFNSFWYQNGRKYVRPRHVVASIMEVHYKAHLAEVMFSTMNQDKPGGEAQRVLSRTMPRIVVRELDHAA